MGRELGPDPERGDVAVFLPPHTLCDLNPEDCITNILSFINFEEEVAPEEVPTEGAAELVNEHLNRSVEELELSVRSYNCLKNANIQTIGDLVVRSESDMLKTKNFGRKSLNEIREILSSLGLMLGMRVDEQGRLVPTIGMGSVEITDTMDI